MLERQGGEIIFECDSCTETLQTGESEFTDALGTLRSEDWTSRKIGGEWIHLCPKCKDYNPRQRSWLD